MGWKETIEELASKVEHMDKTLKYVHAAIVVHTRLLEGIKHQLEAVAKERGQSADRMADRLIEMAMVNKGMTRDAAAHRRSLGESEAPQDLWQDAPDTEWPPKGFDALSMP